MTEFCIVLVEPEHPHNIGFCARAMRSYGQHDLRVVRHKELPRMAWDTAHASGEILDNAKVTATLAEAIADCGASVAFSRRVFDAVVPHIALPQIASYEGILRERVALVFGRESKGLSGEELEQCSVQCEIPVAGNMSLNIAQAVSVGLYELCRAGFLTDQTGLAKRHRSPESRKQGASGHAQWEALVKYLSAELDGRNSLNQPWSESAIRKWLHRLAPDTLELRALFGIVRTLARSSARKEKS